MDFWSRVFLALFRYDRVPFNRDYNDWCDAEKKRPLSNITLMFLTLSSICLTAYNVNKYRYFLFYVIFLKTGAFHLNLSFFEVLGWVYVKNLIGSPALCHVVFQFHRHGFTLFVRIFCSMGLIAVSGGCGRSVSKWGTLALCPCLVYATADLTTSGKLCCC